MTTKIGDRISLVTETKVEAGGTYVAKGCSKADPEAYPNYTIKKVQFSAKVDTGSGWVKIYDVNHEGLTMMELEITNTAMQDFDEVLSNWSTDGIIKMECQIKGDGESTITLYECSVEVV